jgi:hypothetical protein
MWGGASSGKTAFLAATKIASLDPASGNWMLMPEDGDSEAFLNVSTNRLLRDRLFPPGTLLPQEYRFRLRGRPSTAVQERSAAGGSGRRLPVEILLKLQDPPGGLYRMEDPEAEEVEQLTRYLASAHGVLYMFDPTGEDAYGAFSPLLHRLQSRLRAAGQLTRAGRLPHSVAVCMTKFDDPRVFERARGRNLVQQDTTGARTPRVPHDLARDLLAVLAYDQGDRLLVSTLDNFFEPERVAYFATSAVGFLTTPAGEVDLARYVNVNQVGDTAYIVGDVAPINVLEPLIWLDRNVRTYR